MIHLQKEEALNGFYFIFGDFPHDMASGSVKSLVSLCHIPLPKVHLGPSFFWSSFWTLLCGRYSNKEISPPSPCTSVSSTSVYVVRQLLHVGFQTDLMTPQQPLAIFLLSTSRIKLLMFVLIWLWC